MKDPEKITGIYERKLIRRLLQTDQQTNALYRKFIERTSPILAKYRYSSQGFIYRDNDLDKKLNSEINNFRKGIEKLITENQAWAWALSNEKNREIIQTFISDLPVSKIIQHGINQRNIDAYLAFQKRKYNGMNLSERVWQLANGNKEVLEYYLDAGLSIGRSAQEIGQDIQQLLDKPEKLFRRVKEVVKDSKGNEVIRFRLSKAAKSFNPGRGRYRSSVQNARRLARTEINMAYRSSDHERWNSIDFVLGYEVCLSGQHPAPDICDYAAGKYPKSFTFVGWHPNCLCYSVPILPDKDTFMKYLNDKEPLPDKIKDIPKSMKNYIAENSDKMKGWKKQPFWVQDNFNGGRIEEGLKFSLFSKQ